MIAFTGFFKGHQSWCFHRTIFKGRPLPSHSSLLSFLYQPWNFCSWRKLKWHKLAGVLNTARSDWFSALQMYFSILSQLAKESGECQYYCKSVNQSTGLVESRENWLELKLWVVDTMENSKVCCTFVRPIVILLLVTLTQKLACSDS